MKPGPDAGRWAEVMTVFDEVVGLDPATRERRLEAISSSDPELHSGITALLLADASAGSGLERIEQLFDTGGGERDPDPLGMVGRTVSHFRIIEGLASGGMGVIYRAEDTQLGRPIALKFPLPAHPLDRSAKRRFVHEARLAGGLDHPNLCGIYEAGETDDGHLFLAMPLYVGETLRQRLARDEAIPPAESLRIARQIASGLRAAHDAGIVHRDLKPANVMLLRDGTVKILDFGLAIASDTGITQPGTLLGTVRYMSPEQVNGKSIDARADLWSFGVVLYEMVAGRRPFDGGHEIAIAHAIVHADPPLPSAVREGIPSGIDSLVESLLRKDRDERYQTAAEVEVALEAVQLTGSAPRSDSARRKAFAAFVPSPVARLAILALVVVTAAGAIAWNSRGIPAVQSLSKVVVLPFDDSTGNEDNRYLASGFSDAIRAELSRLSAAAVPGYFSSSSFARTAEPLTHVARELGPAAVVRGTAWQSGERAGIRMQLLDAASGRLLWTHEYEPVTPDAEGHAMRAIVSAMRLELTDVERARLARPATTDARAYDLYLRARHIEVPPALRLLWDRVPPETVREAQALYSKARDLDPDFAVARAKLAMTHMLSSAMYDTSQARRDQARLEAEAALRLDPALFEAREALWFYWLGKGDQAKAIEALEEGLRVSPNQPALKLSLGDSFIRAGRWEDASAQLDRTLQIDPRNPRVAWSFAMAYGRRRRNAEAMYGFNRVIAEVPNDPGVKIIKGHNFLRWKGTADTLAAMLDEVPADWDNNGMATFGRYTALRVQRRYADALEMLDKSTQEVSRDGLVYHPKSLMRAEMYNSLGDSRMARIHYRAARALLADSAAARPRNPSIHAALGLANAGLGRKEEAMRSAQRAMEIVPVSRSSIESTAFMGLAVEIFGKVGEIDSALELVELLLAMPSGREITIPFLRVWPGFDPLRSDPRFEQLLERFAVTDGAAGAAR